MTCMYLRYISTRMLSMHNNLMKRYQKELRTNTAQVEQITTLSVSLLIFNIIWFPKLFNNMETVLCYNYDYC